MNFTEKLNKIVEDIYYNENHNEDSEATISAIKKLIRDEINNRSRGIYYATSYQKDLIKKMELE